MLFVFISISDYDSSTLSQEKKYDLRDVFGNRRTKSSSYVHLAEKARAEIVKDYDFMPSAFDRWLRQHKTTVPFEEKDNRILE